LLIICSDTRSRISVVEENLKAVGCDQLAAFVIYDLPGRDCAAKASNGELAVGELSVYKSEYIDRKSIHKGVKYGRVIDKFS
jgi:cellulose 1,4-beta-cellobiosidase